VLEFTRAVPLIIGGSASIWIVGESCAEGRVFGSVIAVQPYHGLDWGCIGAPFYGTTTWYLMFTEYRKTMFCCVRWMWLCWEVAASTRCWRNGFQLPVLEHGPRSLTDMLLLKSFTSDDRSIVPPYGFLPQTHTCPLLSLRTRVFHPNTRIYVRLLGPCSKTGRWKPFRQHRVDAVPADTVTHSTHNKALLSHA